MPTKSMISIPKYWPLSMFVLLLLALHAGVVNASTTLVDLYDISLEADPEYQSAVAANLAAQELTPQARSFLLPTLSAGGAARHRYAEVRRSAAGTGSTDWGSQLADISLSQPVYHRDLWIQL